MAKDDPYKVGYGKPPVNSRFKKGQSGNPAGRPRGQISLFRLMVQVLTEKVTVTENGRRKVKTKMEVALTQMVNKAAGGDLKAIKMLLLMQPLLEPQEADSQTPDLVADRAMAKKIALRLAVKLAKEGGHAAE